MVRNTDNPMGTDGFEFIEFSSPDTAFMETELSKLGFTEVAKHKSKQVTLFRQGHINFILNAEPDSQAEQHSTLQILHECSRTRLLESVCVCIDGSPIEGTFIQVLKRLNPPASHFPLQN